MQSYCSFSVGGTIAVNAHGITSDHCLAQSVVSFNIVDANGDVTHCDRDSKDVRQNELFRCAIGGYGLFGVITEVEFEVEENCLLDVDAILVTVEDFRHYYETARE